MAGLYRGCIAFRVQRKTSNLESNGKIEVELGSYRVLDIGC